jgi:hypothetical protein
MAWLSLARQSRRSSFFFGTSSIMIASCNSPAPHAARALKRPVHIVSQAPPPPPQPHAHTHAHAQRYTHKHQVTSRCLQTACVHTQSAARTRTCMTPGQARRPAGTNLRALGGCLRAWPLRWRTSRFARRSWPQIPPARPPISARRPSSRREHTCARTPRGFEVRAEHLNNPARGPFKRANSFAR